MFYSTMAMLVTIMAARGILAYLANRESLTKMAVIKTQVWNGVGFPARFTVVIISANAHPAGARTTSTEKKVI